MEWKVEDIARVITEKSFPLPQASLAADGWRLEGSVIHTLLQRVQANGISLGTYTGKKIYYGIKTGLNEASSLTGPQEIR